MSTSRFKNSLPHVLSIIAVIVFLGYLYQNADKYQQLLNVSAESFVLLVGLILMAIFGSGLINYLLYQALGVKLSLNESIGLAAVNALANHLPFTGGLIAKGVYLKHRHELTYTRYLGATMAMYGCFIAVNGGAGVVALSYLALAGQNPVSKILALGFFGMAASVILLWLPLDLRIVPGKWGRRLTQVLDGWYLLSQHRLLFVKLIGMQMLMILIFAGRLWIAFHVLSQEVTVAHSVLFASANILTSLVNITPGALGVREGIVAGVAAVLGFDAGVSVVAVGIDRLVATGMIIALGTMYTYVLSESIATARPSQSSTTQGEQETA